MQRQFVVVDKRVGQYFFSLWLVMGLKLMVWSTRYEIYILLCFCFLLR